MTTSALTGDIESVAASLILGQPEEEETKAPAPETDAEPEVAAEAPEEEAEAYVDDANDTEAEAAEEPEGPPRYTVKVDGREVEVTLDELTRSYSGQAYIQQRMREAAEARKAVEAEMAQVQRERAMLAEAFATVQQQMMVEGAVPEKPDLRLLQTDPLRYHEEKAIYDAHVERLQQVSLYQQHLMQQQAAEQEAAQRAYLAEQARILAEAIPAIADPQKGPALKRQLVEAGTAYGFDPDEVASVADARYVQVLHDAAQWRALQASKGQVLQKVQEARPVVRPGTRPPSESSADVKQRQARDRMKRTGSVEDVAKFLLT